MYLRLEEAEYLQGHIFKQEIEVKGFKDFHHDYINLWWTAEVSLAQVGHIAKDSLPSWQCCSELFR